MQLPCAGTGPKGTDMTTKLTVLATGGTIAGIAGSAIAKDYRAGEIGIDAYLEDVGDLGLVVRPPVHAALLQRLLRDVDADHVERVPLVKQRLQSLVYLVLGAYPNYGAPRVGLGAAQVAQTQVDHPPRLARPRVADAGERAPPRLLVAGQI